MYDIDLCVPCKILKVNRYFVFSYSFKMFTQVCQLISNTNDCTLNSKTYDLNFEHNNIINLVIFNDMTINDFFYIIHVRLRSTFFFIWFGFWFRYNPTTIIDTYSFGSRYVLYCNFVELRKENEKVIFKQIIFSLEFLSLTTHAK